MKKYWVYFTLYWQTVFTYRFDTAVYALTGMIGPLLGLFIWLAISQSNPNLGVSSKEIAFYFLAVAWCSSATNAWSAYFIGEDVKKGAILGYLSKPFSILENSAINNISEKIIKMAMVTLAVFAFWIVLSQDNLQLPINLKYLPLFMIALIGSLIMMILIDVCMGLAAFWFNEIDFIISGFFMLDALLSGKVIPLQFLPGFLQSVSFYSPFRYIVSFPIELLMGKLNPFAILEGFLILSCWLAIFWKLEKILYQNGTKRFQGYGG